MFLQVKHKCRRSDTAEAVFFMPLEVILDNPCKHCHVKDVTVLSDLCIHMSSCSSFSPKQKSKRCLEFSQYL